MIEAERHWKKEYPNWSYPLYSPIEPALRPRGRSLWQRIKSLMTQCAVTHRMISTDREVLGGIPHIAGTRLSVGQVLGRLYTHGSIGDVMAYYDGRVSAEQIREAIAYAQDFIEAVCAPPESDG